jgi:hypothetical protein
MKVQFFSFPSNLSQLGKLLGCVAVIALFLLPEVAIAVKLPKPPRKGAEGNRGSALSRDLCTAEQSVTVLAPEYRADATTFGVKPKVWGLTVSERPKFWVHISPPNGNVKSVSFMLMAKDQTTNNTKLLFAKSIKPKSGGIIGFDFPASVPGLQVEQSYMWMVKLNMACTTPNPLQAKGWIQRVGLSRELNTQIENAAPLQKAALYAENGVWYDALTILAEQHRVDPSQPDVTGNWSNALNSLGLQEIANQPIVP